MIRDEGSNFSWFLYKSLVYVKINKLISSIKLANMYLHTLDLYICVYYVLVRLSRLCEGFVYYEIIAGKLIGICLNVILVALDSKR